MFNQLKPLIQNGERYIIVEDGRPEYVLMRFSDYARLAGTRANAADGVRPQAESASRSEWERANAEFEAVRQGEPAFRTAEFGVPVPAADPTTIRLEDLPL